MSNILFSDNDKSSNNQMEQQELSAEDSLKLLVGDNAKYKTVEDMAKAMLHSQNHITKLESEATTYKESQAKQTSIDDILAAIKSNGEQKPNLDDNQEPADQQTPGSEQVDIAKTVQDALAAQTATVTAKTNSDLVRDTLAKLLGDRAATVYAQVGQQMGVDLDKLSEQSPQAVINLVAGQQTTQQQSTGTLPGSTVNNNQADVGGELTRSKINLMYKNGELTRDAKFRLEHAQAQKLGRKFFD